MAQLHLAYTVSQIDCLKMAVLFFSVTFIQKKTRSSCRFVCSVLRRKHHKIDANFLSLLAFALQDKFTEYFLRFKLKWLFIL
jgi:hypothetical protein